MANRIKFFLFEVSHSDVFQYSRAQLDSEENIAYILPSKHVQKLASWSTFSLSWYLHLLPKYIDLFEIAFICTCTNTHTFLIFFPFAFLPKEGTKRQLWELLKHPCLHVVFPYLSFIRPPFCCIYLIFISFSRPKSTLIYHCTSGNLNPCNWGKMGKCL